MSGIHMMNRVLSHYKKTTYILPFEFRSMLHLTILKIQSLLRKINKDKHFYYK